MRTAGTELPTSFTSPTPSTCASIWLNVVEATAKICSRVACREVRPSTSTGASAELTSR